MAPPQACSSLGAFCAPLRRNPDAARAIGALGLLVAVGNVPNSLVVSSLQGEIWGDKMAEYQSMVNLAMYTLAIFATGPLGRLGDMYGNRAAVAVVTVLTALPTYTLLLFGSNELGLTMWSVARVLSGMSGASMSGSPAVYALLNEVSAPEDIEPILGMGFAGASLFWMISNLLGLVIARHFPGSPRAPLLYVALLSVLAMAVLASLKTQARGGKRRGEALEDLEGQRGAQTDEQNKEEGGNSSQGEQKSACLLLDSIRFACGHRVLGALCAIAALVSIPETVLFDVQTQFAYSVLGLLGHSHSGEDGAHEVTLPRDPRHERMLVAILTALAIQVALFFGSYISGLLAKRLSSRRLLFWLIPLASLMQSLPALLVAAPTLGAVVISSAMLGLSLMVLPPLQALVAQVAPADRVSEAMGAVGAFKCLASVVGNLLVTCVVPLLERTRLSKPLWVLYPACGLISLSAVLVLRRLKHSARPSPEASAAQGPKADAGALAVVSEPELDLESTVCGSDASLEQSSSAGEACEEAGSEASSEQRSSAGESCEEAALSDDEAQEEEQENEARSQPL